MKNADETAFPFEGGNNNGVQPSSGLTKREYFAALAMQARASIPGRPDYEIDAKTALDYADALLAELERGQ